MKCTECGREIGENQKFCNYCGVPVKQIDVSTGNTGQTKKCKSCGAILKPENAFCVQCGTPVSTVEVKVPVVQGNNKAKGGKAGKIIIVVITIIALVLVAFVCYYFADQHGVFNRDIKESEDSRDVKKKESVDKDEESTKPVVDEETESDESSVANSDAIDVEAIVLQIRDKYDKIVNGISSNSYDVILVDEGVIAYSEQNEIKAIVVKQGYEGYAYARSYYYDGDKLFFAYYEDSDSHKFYFNNEQLIRWRYSSDAEDNSKAINYDFENTSEYYRWKNDVLAESEKLLTAWENVIANGTGVQEYILVGSDSRYISKSELQGFTAEQCRLARNEIYARHGRKFDDEYLQSYFSSKAWYTPTIDSDKFEESFLNPYEIANRDLIVEYEGECGYR